MPVCWIQTFLIYLMSTSFFFFFEWVHIPTKYSYLQWLQTRITHRILGTRYFIKWIWYHQINVVFFCKKRKRDIASFILELFSDKIINFRCSKNIYKIIILTEMLTVSLLYWVSTSQAKATLIYSVWKLKDIYLCAKELYLTLICLSVIIQVTWP